MGVDCVFVAKNVAGLTISTLRTRVASWPGGWPGGSGTIIAEGDSWALSEPDPAYHWFEFLGPSAPDFAEPPNPTGEYLVVHDGCRVAPLGGEKYRERLREAIRDLAGADEVYLCGDSGWSGIDSIRDLFGGEG